MPFPKRILLVDDEPTILLGLSYILQRAGAQVTVCLGRDQATRAIQDHAFELALLDVRLSGSDPRAGLDLLTLLKTRSPCTHVIIMTGFGSDEIRREALARGATHYCDKPFNLDQFLRLVQELPELSPRESRTSCAT